MKSNLCTGWRVGSKAALLNRFIAVRVNVAREYHPTFGLQFSFHAILVGVYKSGIPIEDPARVDLFSEVWRYDRYRAGV